MVFYSVDIAQQPAGAHHGHHIAMDDNYSALIDVDPQVPVAPLFGRDLAGRIIYLSYGPLKKGIEEWSAYGADKRVGEGDALDMPGIRRQAITFPKGCRTVEAPGGQGHGRC